jgi:sulfonate transport system substrate-binding protein
VQTLATAAKLSPDVARRQLRTRTKLDIDPVPGPAQHTVLARLVPLLVSGGLVRSEQEATTALETLFEPRFATETKGS